MGIEEVLSERGKLYGPFKGHAELTQDMKEVMRHSEGWNRLNRSQRECLEMVVHKIGRIINGDPDYADSWIDIGGYVQLVVNQLKGEKAKRNMVFRDHEVL